MPTLTLPQPARRSYRANVLYVKVVESENDNGKLPSTPKWALVFGLGTDVTTGKKIDPPQSEKDGYAVFDMDEFYGDYEDLDPDIEGFIWGDRLIGENEADYNALKAALEVWEMHEFKLLKKAFPDTCREIVLGSDAAYAVAVKRAHKELKSDEEPDMDGVSYRDRSKPRWLQEVMKHYQQVYEYRWDRDFSQGDAELDSGVLKIIKVDPKYVSRYEAALWRFDADLRMNLRTTETVDHIQKIENRFNILQQIIRDEGERAGRRFFVDVGPYRTSLHEAAKRDLLLLERAYPDNWRDSMQNENAFLAAVTRAEAAMFVPEDRGWKMRDRGYSKVISYHSIDRAKAEEFESKVDRPAGDELRIGGLRGTVSERKKSGGYQWKVTSGGDSKRWILQAGTTETLQAAIEEADSYINPFLKQKYQQFFGDLGVAAGSTLQDFVYFIDHEFDDAANPAVCIHVLLRTLAVALKNGDLEWDDGPDPRELRNPPMHVVYAYVADARTEDVICSWTDQLRESSTRENVELWVHAVRQYGRVNAKLDVHPSVAERMRVLLRTWDAGEVAATLISAYSKFGGREGNPIAKAKSETAKAEISALLRAENMDGADDPPEEAPPTKVRQVFAEQLYVHGTYDSRSGESRLELRVRDEDEAPSGDETILTIMDDFAEKNPDYQGDPELDENGEPPEGWFKNEAGGWVDPDGNAEYYEGNNVHQFLENDIGRERENRLSFDDRAPGRSTRWSGDFDPHGAEVVRDYLVNAIQKGDWLVFGEYDHAKIEVIDFAGAYEKAYSKGVAQHLAVEIQRRWEELAELPLRSLDEEGRAAVLSFVQDDLEGNQRVVDDLTELCSKLGCRDGLVDEVHRIGTETRARVVQLLRTFGRGEYFDPDVQFGWVETVMGLLEDMLFGAGMHDLGSPSNEDDEVTKARRRIDSNATINPFKFDPHEEARQEERAKWKRLKRELNRRIQQAEIDAEPHHYDLDPNVPADPEPVVSKRKMDLDGVSQVAKKRRVQNLKQLVVMIEEQKNNADAQESEEFDGDKQIMAILGVVALHEGAVLQLVPTVYEVRGTNVHGRDVCYFTNRGLDGVEVKLKLYDWNGRGEREFGWLEKPWLVTRQVVVQLEALVNAYPNGIDEGVLFPGVERNTTIYEVLQDAYYWVDERKRSGEVDIDPEIAAQERALALIERAAKTAFEGTDEPLPIQWRDGEGVAVAFHADYYLYVREVEADRWQWLLGFHLDGQVDATSVVSYGFRKDDYEAKEECRMELERILSGESGGGRVGPVGDDLDGIVTPQLAFANRVRSLVRLWQKEGKLPAGKWSVTTAEPVETEEMRNDPGRVWYGLVYVQPLDLPSVRLTDRQAGRWGAGWHNLVQAFNKLCFEADPPIRTADYYDVASLTPVVRLLDPNAWGRGVQMEKEHVLFVREQNLLKRAFPDRYKELILNAPDGEYAAAVARAKEAVDRSQEGRPFDPAEYGWSVWGDLNQWSRGFGLNNDGIDAMIYGPRSGSETGLPYDANQALRHLIEKDVFGPKADFIGENNVMLRVPKEGYTWIVWQEKRRRGGGRYRDPANGYPVLKGGSADTLEAAVMAAHDAAGDPVRLLSGVEESGATCGCGKTYTEEEFVALPLPSSGREWQVMEPEPGADYKPEGYRMRYRNCSCGSTLVIEYPLEGDLGSIECSSRWDPNENAWQRGEAKIQYFQFGTHRVVRNLDGECILLKDIENALVTNYGDVSGKDLRPLTELMKDPVTAAEIPPVILGVFASQKKIAILDGNHRIAVARKLKMDYVPAYVLINPESKRRSLGDDLDAVWRANYEIEIPTIREGYREWENVVRVAVIPNVRDWVQREPNPKDKPTRFEHLDRGSVVFEVEVMLTKQIHRFSVRDLLYTPDDRPLIAYTRVGTVQEELIDGRTMNAVRRWGFYWLNDDRIKPLFTTVEINAMRRAYPDDWRERLAASGQPHEAIRATIDRAVEAGRTSVRAPAQILEWATEQETRKLVDQLSRHIAQYEDKTELILEYVGWAGAKRFDWLSVLAQTRLRIATIFKREYTVRSSAPVLQRFNARADEIVKMLEDRQTSQLDAAPALGSFEETTVKFPHYGDNPEVRVEALFAHDPELHPETKNINPYFRMYGDGDFAGEGYAHQLKHPSQVHGTIYAPVTQWCREFDAHAMDPSKPPALTQREIDALAKAYPDRWFDIVAKGPSPARDVDLKRAMNATRSDEEAELDGVREGSFFVGQDELVEQVKEETPSGEHFDPEAAETSTSFDPDARYPVRRVTWIGTAGKMVKVDSEKILFMEGNLWNLPHAAAIYDTIQSQPVTLLEPPAGRVYRISEEDVEQTQRYEKTGELAYQMGMLHPWTKADVGSYYAQLVDGNHRALAAIASNEPYVYVYVSENYLENVKPEDFEGTRAPTEESDAFVAQLAEATVGNITRAFERAALTFEGKPIEARLSVEPVFLTTIPEPKTPLRPWGYALREHLQNDGGDSPARPLTYRYAWWARSFAKGLGGYHFTGFHGTSAVTPEYAEEHDAIFMQTDETRLGLALWKIGADVAAEVKEQTEKWGVKGFTNNEEGHSAREGRERAQRAAHYLLLAYIRSEVRMALNWPKLSHQQSISSDFDPPPPSSWPEPDAALAGIDDDRKIRTLKELAQLFTATENFLKAMDVEEGEVFAADALGILTGAMSETVYQGGASYEIREGAHPVNRDPRVVVVFAQNKKGLKGVAYKKGIGEEIFFGFFSDEMTAAMNKLMFDADQTVIRRRLKATSYTITEPVIEQLRTLAKFSRDIATDDHDGPEWQLMFLDAYQLGTMDAEAVARAQAWIRRALGEEVAFADVGSIDNR